MINSDTFGLCTCCLFYLLILLDAVITCNDVSKLVAKRAIGDAIRTWKVLLLILGEIHIYFNTLDIRKFKEEVFLYDYFNPKLTSFLI